jgi:hypothetical protein
MKFFFALILASLLVIIAGRLIVECSAGSVRLEKAIAAHETAVKLDEKIRLEKFRPTTEDKVNHDNQAREEMKAASARKLAEQSRFE